jgi:hypothetical protein
MKIFQKFLNVFFSGLMDHPSMFTQKRGGIRGGKASRRRCKEGGTPVSRGCHNWANPFHLGQKWDVEKLLKNTFLQPRNTKNYALDLIHQRERNSF